MTDGGTAGAAGAGPAMKRIFLLTTVLVAPVSLVIAQSTLNPNLRHPQVRPKTPHSTLTPRHRVYAPSAHRSAKPGSVDAQLNKLERQTAAPGTGTASKTTPAPTTTASKASQESGNQPIDFKYQPPRGGSKTTQTGHGSNPPKPGVRSRVNGAGH